MAACAQATEQLRREVEVQKAEVEKLRDRCTKLSAKALQKEKSVKVSCRPSAFCVAALRCVLVGCNVRLPGCAWFLGYLWCSCFARSYT